MLRKYLVLALLIAGLVGFAPIVGASVSPDPDNAAGIDLHSGTVVESLVVGVADTTSGNTVQIGPVGGIYIGGHSVAGGAPSATAISSACVVTSIAYTPQSGDAVDNSNVSEQAITGPAVVTGVSISADTGVGDYIELYDGTSRGDHTTCKLDIERGIADDTGKYEGPPINFTNGVYVYNAASVPCRISYLQQDYLELYDGTSRGTYATCKLDLKGSASEGTIIYTGAPIRLATSAYVYNSNANATWQMQYRIEDEGE